MTDTKSLVIGIIGKPNVGKSTLINALMGEKIAIMSNKPQTTRHRILGVKTTEKRQWVFVDTPGIHTPKYKLNQEMMKSAKSAMSDVELIMWVVDRTMKEDDRLLLENLKAQHVPIVLVINKIDLLKSKDDIDRLIISYMTHHEFEAIIPISAKEGTYLKQLENTFESFAIEGPFMYPMEYKTDQSEIVTIQEWIREKILSLTEEEIPHAVTVVIESMNENIETKTLDVTALIIVERDSQKRILIGKQGEKLKTIGTLARKDLNFTFKRKIHLELWVKVKKNWRDRPADLKAFGIGE